MATLLGTVFWGLPFVCEGEPQEISRSTVCNYSSVYLTPFPETVLLPHMERHFRQILMPPYPIFLADLLLKDFFSNKAGVIPLVENTFEAEFLIGKITQTPESDKDFLLPETSEICLSSQDLCKAGEGGAVVFNSSIFPVLIFTLCWHFRSQAIGKINIFAHWLY